MSQQFPIIQLGKVAQPINRGEDVQPGIPYRQIGVRLWGQGAYERETIDGRQTQYKTLYRVETDDIVVNKIWARNGSVAIVSEDLAGCYGSGEFPTFAPDPKQLCPRWFHWITKTKFFWQACDEKSRGTSGQNRIRPEKFLEIEIPLPPLDEQRRIVARIEALAGRVAEARRLRAEIREQAQQMLQSVYYDLVDGMPYQRMKDVAPIVRRPIEVDMEQDYHELGIRSFGKGTFHKPPIIGADLGSKRIFQIEPGDLLFSNVFSWEGAIAVVKPIDKGRVGSHRFISCVPKLGVATANFLCFHFLTPKGLVEIGEASPGGAGRNRTLGLTKLEEIKVPVPHYGKQLWFDSLIAKVDAIAVAQSTNQAELDALLPAILDKAFRGEL